jgi:hypothetical protein
MFFYTITNIFITLPENVNKSRTSAGRLSLKPTTIITNRKIVRAQPAAQHTLIQKTNKLMQKKVCCLQVINTAM